MVWPKEGYFWSQSSWGEEREATVPTGLEGKRELGSGPREAQRAPGHLARPPPLAGAGAAQPGCELGLRRTLLAARGRYSLCLSASTAAAAA